MTASPPGDRTGSPWNLGLVEAIRIDLVRLHESWMALVFPRQREAKHTVLGKWKPRSRAGLAKYRVWGVLGALIVAVLYPLVLAGFATRFYTRRINQHAMRIGVVGVFLVSVVVWGALTIVARFRFPLEGFLAVLSAAVVATVSAMLAVVFAKIGGRWTTVVFAYPFAVTAIFLPPVVAALFSPGLAEVVFPRSDTIAIWILDTILARVNLASYFRANFELVGPAYAGMWFGIAVPVGWFLGLLVTLANVVRPQEPARDPAEA